MPEELNKEAAKQLETRVYGLALRLKQAGLLALYHSEKGQYYELSYDSETEEWRMDAEILPFVSDRLFRVHALVQEMRRFLANNHATKAELSGADEVFRCIGPLCSMQRVFASALCPDNRPTPAYTPFEDLSEVMYKLCMRLPKVEETVKAWIGTISHTSDMPNLRVWNDLGTEIVQFFDERDRPGCEDEPPIFFPGVVHLDFDDCKAATRRWIQHEVVTQRIRQLGLVQADLLPPLNEKCPYQKWIVDNGLIPDEYPNWLQIEAGFWQRIYGLPPLLPPTYRRRHLLLQWRSELSADEETRCNIVLMKRWNSLNPSQRWNLAGITNEIKRETVKKDLTLAAKEVHERGNQRPVWLF